MNRHIKTTFTVVLTACAVLVTTGRGAVGTEATAQGQDHRPWATAPWLAVDPEPKTVAEGLITYARSVGVDSRSNIYAIHQSDGQARLAVLSPDLDVIESVPPSALGLSTLSVLHVAGDDSIVITDVQASSVVLVQFDGRIGTPATVPLLASGNPVWARITGGPGGPDHNYLVRFSDSFDSSDDPDVARFDVVRRMDGNGRVLQDSVLVVPADEWLVMKSGNGISVAPHPFGKRPLLTVIEGNRLVYAHTGDFSVRVLNDTGTELSTFAFSVEPTSVTEEDIAASRARQSEKDMLRETAPHTWPVLTGLAGNSRDNVIWVGIRGSDAQNNEWAAFTSEGGHLGSVLLPASFFLHAVTGNKLIGTMDRKVTVYTTTSSLTRGNPNS